MKNFIFILPLAIVLSFFVHCSYSETNRKVMITPRIKAPENIYNDYFTLRLRFTNRNLVCYQGKCTFIFKKWLIDDFKIELSNNKSCKTSSQLHKNKISSLERQIAKNWFDCDSIDKINDQWNNSGSCSLDLPALNDESKYFKKSIELFNKFNIDDILQSSNISDNQYYTYETIFTALSKGLEGRKPRIMCDSSGDRNYLVEIILSFDQSFNLINNAFHDYTGIASGITDCQAEEEIYYGKINNWVET